MTWQAGEWASIQACQVAGSSETVKFMYTWPGYFISYALLLLYLYSIFVTFANKVFVNSQAKINIICAHI